MLLHLTPTVFCPKRMEVNVITPHTHCVLSQTDGSECYYTSHPLCFVPNGWNVITPYTHCVLSQTDGSECYYTLHPLCFVPNGWKSMLLHLTPTVFCPKRMEVNVITPHTHCVLSQTDGGQCYYTSHPLCFVPINGVLLNRLCVWILHQLKTTNFLLFSFIKKKKKEKRLTYFAGRPCVF